MREKKFSKIPKLQKLQRGGFPPFPLDGNFRNSTIFSIDVIPYPGSPRVVVYAGFEEVVAPVGNIWVLLLTGEVGTIDS